LTFSLKSVKQEREDCDMAYHEVTDDGVVTRSVGDRVPDNRDTRAKVVTYKTCPVCHKELKTQGYGGHMASVHGVKTGTKAELADLRQRMEASEATLYSRIKLKRVNLAVFDGYWVCVVPVDEGKK
jgi:hypothetical protein